MANRFAALRLIVALHDLPLGYSHRLKQFNGERGYSAEEHLGWFLYWINLEEVDHDDVKLKLFSQILLGEARKWYKNPLNDSILSYKTFEYSFKDMWKNQKNPKQYLSQCHSMRRR